MKQNYAWGFDLIHSDNIAMESFGDSITQGPEPSGLPAYFKPVNIVVENGIHYVTIYVCSATNRTSCNQQLLMWLGSLKETDYVKLVISSFKIGLPVHFHLSLLSAIVRCKATIEIQLDSIVCDNLAYFYLAADKVNPGKAGALFIPSYVDSNQDEKSATWRVVHEFINEIVAMAASKGILTDGEVQELNSGKPVIIPQNRLQDLF